MHQNDMNIPLIILAAGNSSRMGEAKQLLLYHGKSLLRHAVDTAIGSEASSIVVVLGSRKKQIEQELTNLPVTIVENSAWQQGMGSSIRAGMTAIDPEADGVIVMLCDQPKLTSHLLNELIYHQQQQSSKAIIASAYGGKLGVPALFSSDFFPSLSKLSETIGAKKLIQQNHEQVHPISFPMGIMDVDTPEDYQNLI